MNPTAIRLVSLTSLAVLASLLGACQTASVSPTSSAMTSSFSAVPALRQANPDVLGGLFGRESIATLALSGSLGANQAAYAALQDPNNSGL